jgi:outer membrane immunogenic protein
MKTLLAVLLSCVAMPALAADLPGKAPTRPAAVADWTGFYIGVHGGYGWGKPSIDDIDLNSDFDKALRISTPELKGWVFGGHAGYNWQWQRVVGGLEIDYSAADIKEDQSRAVRLTGTVDDIPATLDFKRTLSAKLDALASARARLGFLLFPEFLLYGTGGIAWGHTKVDASFSEILTVGGRSFNLLTETGQSNENHWGWVAGVGGEWRVFGAGSGWSLRAEYLHYDFGDTTHTVASRITSVSCNGGFCGTNTGSFNASLRADVVRGGLSLKF